MTDASWENLSALYVIQARDSVAEWVERLRSGALSRKDLQDFRIAVHRLRGTGSSFGLPWLTDGCATLDNEAAALLRAEELPTAEAVRRWRDNLEEMATRLAAT